MKKTAVIFLALALMLSASGCSAVFSDEYYYSEPFTGEVSIGDGTEREVRNFSTLKSAILELVYAGESEGHFRFGSYSGSLIDDLAAVCLEIKSATPIGAYAVEDISYDSSRIVSYYTADISISYKKSAEEIASVVNISGLGELGSHLLSVMDSYAPETVVKIYSSAASEDYIRSFVSESYYSDPFLTAVEPALTVAAYPESGPERIYVIDFRYSAMPERLEEMDGLLRSRAEELAASLGEDEPLSLALRCAMMFSDMCANSTYASAWPDTAYGSVVEGSGDPMALAMGYKALCDCLGIPCTVVRGEISDGGVTSHAWNIIEIEGEHYHVDISRFAQSPGEAFLLSDEDVWGEYYWDRESYPVCEGSLGPEDVFTMPEEKLPESDEAPVESQQPVESEPPTEPEQSSTPSQSPLPEGENEAETPEAEQPVE